MKKQSTVKSLFQSNWLIFLAPLISFPFMINLRVMTFIAPNEEPKWAALTVCALWMGLAAAWLWLKKGAPVAIKLPGLSGMLLALFILILGIGIYIGPNTTEGYIRFAFWFFCIAVFLISSKAMKEEKTWLSALSWSLSIGSFLFSFSYWWSYFLDYGKPNYNIHVLFSPIGHVNFTGDVLIMLLPVIIWILATNKKPVLQVINWFSATTIMTVLLVASSRGALGGIAIATAITSIVAIKHLINWKRQNKKPKSYLPIILIGTALLTSVISYNLLPFHYRDLARVSASAGQTISGEGRITLSPNAEQPPFSGLWEKLSPFLGTRTPIFASTTAMTLDAPLLGQGTGNFAWVYPGYSNRFPDFRDPLSSPKTFTTNPHNVILQIASQNGIIAVTIFSGLLLYFWWSLLKESWSKFNGWKLAGLTVVTAAIFDSMFNHVFFNPASMFVFALLAGSWWNTSNQEQKPLFTLPAWLTAAAATMVIITLSIWPARWVVSEWYAGQAMRFANYPQYEANYYKKAYHWDNENFRAVFGMGQVAYKQKKYQDSARYFEEFEAFYPYNPPALNMLAAAYMSSGQFIKAEAALKRALKTYPGYDMAEQNLARVRLILGQNRVKTK